MTEKYTDLAEQVIGGSDRSNTVSFRIGVAYAFEWLDEHPDQVPGRTITESEAKPLRGIMVRRDGHPALKIEDYLGLTVVPDPEPTNAEKLETLLRAADADNSTQHYPRFAEWLDQHGVKAPGGDE